MWRERVHTAFEEQWENLVNIGDGRELYLVGNESGHSHLFTRQQTLAYLLGARCVPAAWATKVATVGAESGGEAQDRSFSKDLQAVSIATSKLLSDILIK